MNYTPKALRTRGRILDCAAERLLADGYIQLKLDDVLEGSRVRKGNFYYYFANKDDLCLAVLKERAQPLLAKWLEQQLDPQADPWDNLQQLGQAAIARSNGTPSTGNPYNTVALELCGINEDYKREVTRLLGLITDAYRREFDRLQGQGRLKPGASTGELAQYAAGLVQGAQLVFRMHGDQQQFQHIVSTGLQMLQG